MSVEPGRLVVPDPRGKDLRLPCFRRGLETFERGEREGHGIRPFEPWSRERRDAGEQEAHEVARRDRFDFRPQAIEGVAVDARQQAAGRTIARR